MSSIRFKKFAKLGLEVIIVSGFAVYVALLFAATTPSPGHPWLNVGDGTWAATGTTAYRTFTFPNATATVLTDHDLVTVAQGGTGANSTSSAFLALSGLGVKGDIIARGASIAGRLALGVDKQVFTADSAQSLGVKWADLIVPAGGSNTQIQFNDGGVFNGSSSLTFDNTLGILGLNGIINMTAQADPAAAAADTFNLYVKKVSGRMLLKGTGPSGVDYAYQPSFFQNGIFIISTGAGTAYSTLGNTLTSVGTVSHVVSEPLGYMANQISGNAAGSTAGTGSATTPYFVGSQTGSNGFFYQARMAFPDATSTGIRAFVGFTSGTMAASVSADDPAGSGIGWQYSTSRADTGWKFMTDDGTTQNVSSTIIPFQQNAVFDFFIYLPPYPNNTKVYYRIDNLTAGTTAEGSTTSNLPAGTTQLRAGFQISNVNSGTRKVRVNRVYVETDR